MILIHLFPNHSFLGVNEELEVFKDFSRLSLSILNISTDPNIHLQFQYVGGTKYVTTQTTTITIIPAFRHSSYPPRSFHILPSFHLYISEMRTVGHSLPKIRFVFHKVIISVVPERHIQIAVIGVDFSLFQPFSEAVRRLTDQLIDPFFF